MESIPVVEVGCSEAHPADVIRYPVMRTQSDSIEEKGCSNDRPLEVKVDWQYVTVASRVFFCWTKQHRQWPGRSTEPSGVGISPQGARQQRQWLPPPYITTHPQQPFFSAWSSVSNVVFWGPFPFEPGAPVYDDISLLYLRISRTIS